jgi:hypothetical protein
MAEDSLDFANDRYEPQPPTARFVTLRLVAFFPVQANAGVILFAKPTEASKTWTVVAKGEVDNNKFTEAGESVTFPLKPGTFYALQFAGQAQAVDPKASEIRMDFHVSVDGGAPLPLGGPKQASRRSIEVHGGAYFHT